MARTIQQIQDEIISTKDATPVLSGLNSGSASAIFRLIAYVVATAIWIHENLFDKFKAEVESNISARHAGTVSWYVDQVYKYQYGDSLLPDGTYAAVNTDKRIVSRCAGKEATDGDAVVLQLRVAKGPIGSEQPLTAAEINGLKGYLNRIKFAGTKTQIISLNGDKLRLTAEVFYDGIKPQAEIQEAVETGLRSYLANLYFSGTLYKSKLVDTIQAVDGVIDVSITSAVAVVGDDETTIARVYESQAGYIVEDDSEGNTFSDLITYTPQNV